MIVDTHEALPERTRRSTLVLVASNLLPLIGVLFFDWDMGAIVVLYWSENLILGFYNILKMVSVKGIFATFPSMFFIIHYGGFCGVHGMFILGLMFDEPLSAIGNDAPWPFFLVFVQILLDVIDAVMSLAPSGWIIAFGGLFISHGYSFVRNFLASEERHTATIESLMKAPYKRIMVLHVAVIAGGFGITALGEPLVLLLALIALKLAVDINLHRREHRLESQS